MVVGCLRVMGDSLANELAQVSGPGERHLPALDPESINHYRHMTAYHFARGFVAGRDVVDMGCGTGYGTNFLLRKGEVRSIIGLDVSSPSIDYCRRQYPDLAPCFAVAEPNGRSLPTESADIVLLFQVIEHVAAASGFLATLTSILRRGGMLLLTTPNVAVESHDGLHPANPHHIREYDRSTLAELCRPHLRVERELAVHGSLRVNGRGLGWERSVVFRALRKVVRKLVPPEYVPGPSLADFRISARAIDRGMDLLFVCRRV
jgi:2-polyprenyl-3-methyl-5-hydroxy-6-metoxy-1,4-benzoquinol methylase